MNETLIHVLLFILGLACLIKGGDWFVDGASALARKFHLPELLIGATVVSIGTTLPEVMVSTISAVEGHGEIAYGNAIGSVICNAALIAAISLAVRPGKVDPKTLKTPVAFFVLAAAIYCVAAYLMGEFIRPLGLIMLAVFVIYMIVTVRQMKKNPEAEAEAEAELVSVFGQAAEKNGATYTDRFVSYEKRLASLGYVNEDDPDTIRIYATDFEGKDKIVSWIEDYNASAKRNGADEEVISYTDYVGLMMSSISTIINAISYVLIGFVAISLIVSSIMIGVITYISVLERTKEIGILRSIGASKRDISRVFNAETFIIGLVAGLLGVFIATLLDVPVNLILAALANLHGIAAVPWWGGIMLVSVSILLTLVAGIIPSRIAAKKDPVIALRSE